MVHTPQEFGKCGDILQWGAFGQPQANFLHLQYQNKYAAQRALQRNGEQLSASLIVGVKPLDHRHRQGIESYLASGAVGGGGGMDGHVPFGKHVSLPDRPYRIEALQAAAMPQPRSTVSKVVEFVFGF